VAAPGQGRRRPPAGAPHRRGPGLTGQAPWLIRPLGQGDLPLYRPLRLEARREHPSAFGADYQEEQTADMSRMIGQPPSITLGGFAQDGLVGSAGFVVSPKVKQMHKGHVVGVYVAPAWRGTGLARGLTDGLIAHARAQGLVVLTLSVTVGNAAARRLYLAAGFRPYGLEPRSLKIGPDLLDEELMALLLG
jgi:ribosomal protein S18 acetylase RimI-like enzyme